MKMMLATYDSEISVKESTSNEFEVDYYGKLKEVIELQYHNEQNKFFYSNDTGMIPLIEK